MTMLSGNTGNSDAGATVSQDGGFVAKFEFDLEKGSATKFAQLVDQYSEWHAREPIRTPLQLVDGWITITPQLAEDLLRRNLPGANRKAVYSVIEYYAEQMVAGEWPATGQPLLFRVDGVLIDGQHRLWAALLSGASFKTYVVTGVADYPELFAYIDNSKPRNPAAALQTAGYNGVSGVIQQILKISVEISDYTPTTAPRHAKLAPVEYVRLAKSHPSAQRAARLASSDWMDAVKMIGGYKDVVGYVGMVIIDGHGEEVADDFFGELGDSFNEYPPEGAIAKFRALIVADQKKEHGMKRHQVLGNLIKAFNAWVSNADLPKRWTLAVDDVFPELVEAVKAAA